jgi:hypothetical protein
MRSAWVSVGEFARSGRVDVDDVLQADAGLAHEIAGVDLADPAGAVERNVEHRDTPFIWVAAL